MQRRVVAEPEPVFDPQTGEVGEWLPIWGVFFTEFAERGYTGAWIRAQRTHGSTVIAYHSMTGTTSAFTFPSHA